MFSIFGNKKPPKNTELELVAWKSDWLAFLIMQKLE